MAGEPEEPVETPPEKTPRQQWVEDSDILDEAFDPELDLPQEPVKKPVAAPAAPTPAKQKHSKRLIRMALDLGMTQAEIDAATPEDLDEDVYILHRQALAVAAESRRLSGTQPARQPEPTPAPEVDEDEAALDRLATDGLHEDLVKLIRRQQKELKELKGEVGTVRQRDSQRETTSAANMLDEAFDGLGATYERVVGKGAAVEMQDQDAHGRRISIIMAAGFKDLADVAGQSRAQVRAKIAAAAKKLYGGFLAPEEDEEEDEPPPPPKKVNGRLTAEQWAAAGVARPTHRHTTEPKGTNRATKAVARLQREQAGLNDDVPEGTEEASLPE